MYVLNPIKKKEIPEKVLDYIKNKHSSTKKSNSSSKNNMSKEKNFLQKMIGNEFTILTKDDIIELKLFTDYYGSVSFITDLALDTNKLQKFSFYLDKTGHLKIKISGKGSKDSYTFSPYLYKGVLVSSNAANPVIVRCKRTLTDKCVVIPKVLVEPKKSEEKTKKKVNKYWFF